MCLAQEIFEIEGPSGLHYCITSKPQGNSVRTLQDTFPDAKLPKLVVKSLIHRLFFSLNWVHALCGVAHTGKLFNVSRDCPSLFSLAPHNHVNRYFAPECLDGDRRRY
jgi:hypothetical protein